MGEIEPDNLRRSGGATLSTDVEVWVGRWLERLDDEDVQPEEEASRVLNQAPAELRARLQQEFRSILAAASTAFEDPCVSPGAVSGGYRLERILGEGSAGVVWSATSAEGQRRAIKFVHPVYLASKEGFIRHKNEISAARRVHHPAVNRLLETAQFGGRTGLVSAMVGDGATLATEIAAGIENDIMPNARRVLKRILPVLRGVAALHAADVLHLDLKPGNLLVAEDGSLLVSDFGLARLSDELSGTRTSQMLGTPAYMSPEVASGDRRSANERSDVFSLGVTLYEALCLRRPFRPSARRGVLSAIQNDEPPPLPGSLPGMEGVRLRRLRAVLARCLEKDPRLRYASVEQLADDIGRLLAGRAVHGRSLLRTAHASLRRNQRLVLLLFTLATLAGVLWQDRSKRRDITRVLTITNRLDDARRPGGRLPDRAELELLLIDLGKLLGSVPADTRRLTLQRVGVLLARRGENTDLAVNLFREALSLASDDGARVPLLMELSLAHGRRSELELAVRYSTHAAACLVGQDTPQARLQRALLLAQARSHVSRFNLVMEGIELPSVDEVLALAKETLLNTPPETELSLRTRLELKSLELAGWSEGDGPAAEDLTRMLVLLEAMQFLPDDDQTWEIEALCYVGNVLVDLHRADEAEPYLRRALRRATGSLGEAHLLTLLARLRLARSRLEQGHLQESLREYSLAVAALEAQLGPLNRTVLDYSVGIFVAKMGTRDDDELLSFVEDLFQRGTSALDPTDTVLMLIQRAWIAVCLQNAMPQEARRVLAMQWSSYQVNFRRFRRVATVDLGYAVELELAYPGSPADMDVVLARIDDLQADLLESPPHESIDWDWRNQLEGLQERANLTLAGSRSSLEEFDALLNSAHCLYAGELELIHVLMHARLLRRSGKLDEAAAYLQERWADRAQELSAFAKGSTPYWVLKIEVLEVAAERGDFGALWLLPEPSMLGGSYSLCGKRAYLARRSQLLEEAEL